MREKCSLISGGYTQSISRGSLSRQPRVGYRQDRPGLMPELLCQLTFHLAIPPTTYYRKYHKYHYLQCSNNILVNDHIGIASQN